MAFRPGTRIGVYEILAPLGAGGMGVVYRARDTRLDRTVALKFLPPELTRDAEAKARFLREARVASSLDHPNVCTIYEVGELDDQVFIAMAHYEGETLKQRIDRGPLDVLDALDIAIQTARGLGKAHDAGIVHRDIKPANLIVTTDGLVKILDFGVAKLVNEAGLTQTGTTLGTVAYMSPEQASGAEVDQRSDLWALGVVLYEMLAGRTPFAGEGPQAVIHNLLNREPEPLMTVRSELPGSLDTVLQRALSKDVGQRYQQTAGCITDLQAVRQELETAATQAAETGASRHALDRRAAILEHELGPRAGVLLRWAGRGVDRRPGPVEGAEGRGSHLDLQVQRAGRRHPPDRRAAQRGDGARRQRPQGRCQGRSKIRPPWRRKTRPLGSWVEWRNAAVRRGRQDAGVAAGWRAFLLCSRRSLSPFSSRMWTWWVSRSSSAPVSRSDPKISVHSLKGRFEVTSVDACS